MNFSSCIRVRWLVFGYCYGFIFPLDFFPLDTDGFLSVGFLSVEFNVEFLYYCPLY